MPTMFKRILLPLIIASGFFTGCSCSYHTVLFSKKMKGAVSDVENVEVRLDNNALTNPAKRINIRYVNKSFKSNIYLNVIEIENNSESVLTVGQNVTLTHEDGSSINEVDPNYTYKSLRQKSPLYLLYGLLWVTFYKCDGDCKTYPIPVGAPIAIINATSSANANKVFQYDIMQNNIMGMTVRPGEKARGVLCTRGRLPNVKLVWEE